jgi:GntR family transcriptional regulator
MDNKKNLIRTPGTALHRQIFLVLRDGIVQGTYPPGTPLPKEESLVELFGVARATVRRALADLENEGLVQRRHGSGTFVRGDLSTATAVATLSYIDDLRHTAQTTDVQVLSVEAMAPPPWVSSVLQIPHNEIAIHATRLRLAGDMPLMLTEAWVPEVIGHRITAAALKKRAMYEILMGQGIEFGRVVQQITAEAADPKKAALLKCEIGTALIRLTRLLHDKKGRPIQHLTVHLAPQRSSILMEIPSDAINTLSAGHIVHDPAVLHATDGSMRKPRK